MSVPRRKNVEIFLFSPVDCEMVRQTTLRPGQDQWGLHTPQGTLEVWHIEIVSLPSGPVSEGCLDTSDGQPTSGPTGDVDVWC